MLSDSFLTLIAQPFSYAFMIKAMFGGATVGALCGLLSCFVTLKGWSLLGDALSHSIVPGVAVAALVGGPFILGAFVASLLAVLGISLIERNSVLKNDAVIGVVFTVFFAAGLFIISVFPTNIRIQTILFGNLLGISAADLVQVAIIGVFCIVMLAVKWKDLLIYCFDPSFARVIGLSVSALHLLLLLLLSLAAVAALQAVGALLVVAMLITPGATAQLLTQNFARMLFIAPLLAALACAGGAYISYFLDGSTGGVIVVLQTSMFILALFFAPAKGIKATRRRKALSKGAAR